jgi:hypothetical protein
MNILGATAFEKAVAPKPPSAKLFESVVMG